MSNGFVSKDFVSSSFVDTGDTLSGGFVSSNFVSSDFVDTGSTLLSGGFVSSDFVSSDFVDTGSTEVVVGGNIKTLIYPIKLPPSITSVSSFDRYFNTIVDKIVADLDEKESDGVKFMAYVTTEFGSRLIPSSLLKTAGYRVSNVGADVNKKELNKVVNSTVNTAITSQIYSLKDEIETNINSSFLNAKKEAEKDIISKFFYAKEQTTRDINSKFIQAQEQAKSEQKAWLQTVSNEMEAVLSNYREKQKELILPFSENQLNVLTNKIIEILNLNGVTTINYTPQIANVTFFKEGEAVNIPFERNTDGSLQGKISLNGEYTIIVDGY